MKNGMTVGIAGLGAIGLEVAHALDRDPDGLTLTAVACRRHDLGREKLRDFSRPPAIVSAAELAANDIVVEAMPAAAFAEVATAAIVRGRILVVSSAGALLRSSALIALAGETGARIVVASGALAGLDAVRAVAADTVKRVWIESRKPPAGLIGAPYLQGLGIDLSAISDAVRVFVGNAREAAEGFPANANVAAALALAGIGPERTEVEIWADPGMTRNRQTIHVEAAAARLILMAESEPSAVNPRTGRLAALSVLACLRGLVARIKIGS